MNSDPQLRILDNESLLTGLPLALLWWNLPYTLSINAVKSVLLLREVVEKIPSLHCSGVRPSPVCLILVPMTANTTNSTIEQEYVTVSDISPTAWRAIDWSGFEPGDTDAVFGAGPVGLLAAYAAILRGASKGYSVDRVPMRLECAASVGVIPINFYESDPVQQILAYEPQGVIRSADCVGYEAVEAQGNIEQDIVVRNMIAVTAPQASTKACIFHEKWPTVFRRVVVA